MTTKINMGPPRVDLLRVRAGDRNVVDMTITQDGEAIDVSEWELEAQARLTPHTEPAALTAVVTVVDGPAGVIEIRWPGDDVRELLGVADTWSGVWDLQRNNGSADPETLMAGKFTAEKDVTR